VSAARLASPEGWQVSVALSLFDLALLVVLFVRPVVDLLAWPFCSQDCCLC
jgi:hypothetical protein